MCMKCGCSTPNDKKSGATVYSNGGSGKSVVVPPTNTTSGGYDGNGDD